MRKFLNTTDPSASMFRLLWDHNAMWPRDYSLKQLGRGRDGGTRDGLVCFKVGWDGVEARPPRDGSTQLAGPSWRLPCLQYEPPASWPQDGYMLVT